MALNEETLLLFDRYLENQLSEKEQSEFEIKLLADKEFANEFETYKDVSGYLEHQFSEERKTLKQQLETTGALFFNDNLQTEQPQVTQSQPQVESEIEPSKVIKLRPWQYAIAASVALLIGFFVYNNSGSIAVSNYTFSENISLTVRGTSSTLLKEAETNFNSKKYPEAVINFETLLKNDPNNTELKFYKAMAHDAVEEYVQSEILFQELANGTSVFKSKARFYWGISYWKQDNISYAKEILEGIPDTALEYSKAQKILKTL